MTADRETVSASPIEELSAEAVLPTRRVTFTYPDDMHPMWAPHLPEFAAAANAISLGMPYAEPLFIRAMRSTFEWANTRAPIAAW